jgi:hypothetical protein
MFRKLLGAVLTLALLAGLSQAQAPKKDAKDKPTAGRAAKEFTGKVKSVDPTRMTITITAAGGRDMTFKVTDTTAIVGPRGGVSAERLKDDRLGRGKEVTVVPTADGKGAKEVRLGFRDTEPATGKDKKKDK